MPNLIRTLQTVLNQNKAKPYPVTLARIPRCKFND